MGYRQVDQAALFYEFSLEKHVPADHLLRSIDRFVDLQEIKRDLATFYSSIGRPSIDPELMIRMLRIGYCFGIRSERRLCDEVHLDLAHDQIRRRIAIVSCLFASPALAQDDLLANAKQQFEPIPTAPPDLPANVATPDKVELGKMLYFDPRLSASHAISCSSCHSIGLGGADAEPTTDACDPPETFGQHPTLQ